VNSCKNCGDSVHIPDDRTGLIHANGKYICRKKTNWKTTAAE
jgi:hypothetical protein